MEETGAEQSITQVSNRNKSIIVHSVVGLIVGLVLALVSLGKFAVVMDPKVWGAIGSSIIIISYFPVHVLSKRMYMPSSIGEFLLYIAMGLGAWFSFYPFLLSTFR